MGRIGACDGSINGVYDRCLLYAHDATAAPGTVGSGIARYQGGRGWDPALRCFCI